MILHYELLKFQPYRGLRIKIEYPICNLNGNYGVIVNATIVYAGEIRRHSNLFIRPKILTMKTLFQKANKWYIITGALFIIFSFLTPLSLYNSLGFYLVISQGIICGLFIFFGLIKLPSINDLLYINSEEYPELNKTQSVLLPFVAVIFGAIIISSVCSGRIDNKIKKYGVLTQAVITDGSRTTTSSMRHGTHSAYELNLTFKTKENEKIYVKSDVTDEIYGQVGKDQLIDIMYWPENPQIFKILVGYDNVKEFLGISNRDLKFEDLEKLMIMDIDSIEMYLNKVSVKWIKTSDSTGTMFVNDSKKEIVGRSIFNSLLYKGPQLVYFDSFFRKAVIKDKREESIKNDADYKLKKITTFTTEKYNIQYTLGIGSNMGGDIFMIMRPK